MDRDPESRLRALFDHHTLRPLAVPDDSGVLPARGTVDGTPAIAFATDPGRMGGAIGVHGSRRIVEAIDLAVRERVPVIGVWHSGGARLDEGMVALDAAGQVVAATVRAAGRIPRISLLLGPALGSTAYVPALTDVVIAGPEADGSPAGNRLTGGSAVAGAAAFGRVAHVISDDDEAAVGAARRTVRMLGHPGRLSPADVKPGSTLGRSLDSLLPAGIRGYDVRPLIRALLDEPGLELQETWAPNVVTALGRFAGRTIGVVATNPGHLDGRLDEAAADKTARFVRMCDARALPLLVVVDTPGHLPGPELVISGARLLHAFAGAVVPRVTLLTRRAYGGAYLALNSRALGATAVFAWPDTELAVHDPVEAVPIRHHRRLAATAPEERGALQERLAREQAETAAATVDAVITPAETRRRIAEAFAAAPL